MSILDNIIIGIVLVSVLIVVVVIARSFKSVDDEIVKRIKGQRLGKKKKWIKIKQLVIDFTEFLIRKLRKAMKKLHSWVIREKKKSGNEIVKAKDEFIIKKENKSKSTKKTAKKGKDKNKNSIKKMNKNSILEEVSINNDDTAIDSVTVRKKNRKNSDKTSFIKSLFKRKNRKKKNVDIMAGKGSSSVEKWTLDGSDVSKKAESSSVYGGDKSSDISDDIALGIDRKILEKKILQRIDKDPKNINNYHELGELYIKMKKYVDATEVFGYIVSVSPDDKEARRRQDKIKLLQNKNG